VWKTLTICFFRRAQRHAANSKGPNDFFLNANNLKFDFQMSRFFLQICHFLKNPTAGFKAAGGLLKKHTRRSFLGKIKKSEGLPAGHQIKPV